MKVTQRDKMLLVLLAIILVVALAYILPGVGLSAAMEKADEYEELRAIQEDENNARLSELVAMGVEPAFAERSVVAKNRLIARTEKLKEEAARLLGSIMEYTETYAVNETWIVGLEYRYGLVSDDSNLLLIYNKSNDMDGEVNGEVEYENQATGIKYTLKSAQRTIQFEVADSARCYYNAELTMEEFSPEEMGALLLYLQHLASKGSLLIDEVRYSVKDSSGTVAFTVLMTETDSISTYAREIAQQDTAEEVTD